MTFRFGVPLLVLLLVSCRSYDYYDRIDIDDGFIPGDQYAAYGQEQAQAIAIARRFAELHEGTSPRSLARQAEGALAYARSLPGVATAEADPLGGRLTVTFRSGWRVGITPLDDGQSAADTPGVPVRPRE